MRLNPLVSEEQRAGSYEVTWDGKDDFGNHVASGVYICRLKAESRNDEEDGGAQVIGTREVIGER